MGEDIWHGYDWQKKSSSMYVYKKQQISKKNKNNRIQKQKQT